MPRLTKGVTEWAADGCLVKPVVGQWLGDQSIPLDFHLWIERSGNRPPDAWFHSSGHPRQSEEQLLDYLLYPDLIVQKDFGWAGALGTLYGTMSHSLIGTILDKAGITVPLPEGPCIACGLPRPKHGRPPVRGQCGEHAGRDEETRSKGHLDKILDLGAAGVRGFDLKTRFQGGFRGVPDMDMDFFIQKWPGYYWQGQDYMRITGLRRYIVLFFEMGNPWEMREYHFDFDPEIAFVIESKYKRALEHARRAGVVLAA